MGTHRPRAIFLTRSTDGARLGLAAGFPSGPRTSVSVPALTWIDLANAARERKPDLSMRIRAACLLNAARAMCQSYANRCESSTLRPSFATIPQLPGEIQTCSERLAKIQTDSPMLTSQIFSTTLVAVATGSERWASFGKWLEVARKRRYPSVTAAAEIAGISRSTWDTLEKGGRMSKGSWSVPSPTEDTLVGIARALGPPAREVFERAGMPVPRWIAEGGEPEPLQPRPTVSTSPLDRRQLRELALQLREIADSLLGYAGPL